MSPQQILTTVMTRIVFDKSTDHAKPHSICLLPQYQRWRKKSLSRFVDNWKHRLGLESARAPLYKWATCTRQTVLSKTFSNSLNMQKQHEKNVWEKSNDAYPLSIRVRTTITHISICFFYHNINSKKTFFFFQNARWKRHWATRWCQQRGMDSHRQRKIANQISRLAAIEVKPNFLTKTTKKHIP